MCLNGKAMTILSIDRRPNAPISHPPADSAQVFYMQQLKTQYGMQAIVLVSKTPPRASRPRAGSTRHDNARLTAKP